MGCGCAKVTRSQKELIDDIKIERNKNDQEINKIKAEIEKVNAASTVPVTNAGPTAPAGTSAAGATVEPQAQPADPNPKPAQSPTMNVDEHKVNLEGRIKFSHDLNEIEELLKKAEYIELGTLNDLLSNFFSIPAGKAWGDISKQLDEIKTFCSKNIKPIEGKTQLELSNMIEAGIIKADTEVKDKKMIIDDVASAWIKEYTLTVQTCRDDLKKGDYNNLKTLSDLIDELNRGYDGKNVTDIQKSSGLLKTFFKDNLKPK